MTEPDDISLLREFSATGSESAFAALVSRHLNLVYSTALRSVGNTHAAREISQAVFIILARKANRLPRHAVLSGWLYQTTRLTAANFLRGEIRRQQREQEAYMQSTLNETGAEVWPQIAPLLDDALGKLGERDRNAIVLRFFENKSLQEVGTALGASEDAAKMRVNRALEKLRKIFSQRGVTLSATLIAGAVSAGSVQAAPVGLATTVTVAAKGAAVSATITALVKGTLKLMTYAKLKLAIGITAGILLAGGVVTLAVSQSVGGEKWSVEEIARQTQDSYAALTSYSDTAKGISEGGGQPLETTSSVRLQRPKQYRVEWVTSGGLYKSKGVSWSDGGINYGVMDSANRFATAKPTTARDMQMAFAFADGASGGVISTIAGAFFKLNTGDKLGIFVTGRTETKRLADEKVGGVDCFVVVSVMDWTNMKVPKSTSVEVKKLGIFTTTLWIGKKDHLIRKARTTTAGFDVDLKFTEESLKVQLERQQKPVTPENLAALRTEMENSIVQMKTNRFVFNETHENIVVNQKFSLADFTR